MQSISLILLALLASFASASDYDDYMSQSPPCARPCQKAALEKDGCENIEDFNCHCRNAAIVESIMLPCLEQTSHCKRQEISATNGLKSVCEFSDGTPFEKPSFPSIFPPKIPMPSPPTHLSALPSMPPVSPEILLPPPKTVETPSFAPTSSHAWPSSSKIPNIPSISPKSSVHSSATPSTVQTPASSHKLHTPSMPSIKPTKPTAPESHTTSQETPCPSVVSGVSCPIHSIIHTAPIVPIPASSPAVTKTVVIPPAKPSNVEVPTDVAKPEPEPTEDDDEEANACERPKTTIYVTGTRPASVSGTPGINRVEGQKEDESAATSFSVLLSFVLPVAGLVSALQLL